MNGLKNIPPDTRPHPDFPNVAIGQDSSAWAFIVARHSWIKLKPLSDKYGYTTISFRAGGKKRKVSLAKMVLQAWVGPRPLGSVPLHFPDPDRRNCRRDNLRWADKGVALLGNKNGSISGLKSFLPGSAHKRSVLTEDDIRDIRSLRRSGFSGREVAEKYCVSAACISSIIVGKTWAHVPDPEGSFPASVGGSRGGDHPRSKVDEEDVFQIRFMAEKGCSTSDIASKYRISPITVRAIVRRITWKHII